jgi:hypothetical protein
VCVKIIYSELTRTLRGRLISYVICLKS